MLRIEVRDLLDDDPRNIIGGNLFAVAELAASAGANLRTSGHFCGGLRGYGDESISAGGLTLRLEDRLDQGDASPLGRGRRLEILMIVQELDVEQGVFFHGIGTPLRG